MEPAPEHGATYDGATYELLVRAKLAVLALSAHYLGEHVRTVTV